MDPTPDARRFTFEEAAAMLPEARRRAESLATLSSEIRTANTHDDDTVWWPEDVEEQVDDHLRWFRRQGIQLKSVSPLLLDFPANAQVDGRWTTVLLCWREDEPALAWYHPIDSGYAGRAPIAELDAV
jgi:hypothetical protein